MCTLFQDILNVRDSKIRRGLTAVLESLGGDTPAPAIQINGLSAVECAHLRASFTPVLDKFRELRRAGTRRARAAAASRAPRRFMRQQPVEASASAAPVAVRIELVVCGSSQFIP